MEGYYTFKADLVLFSSAISDSATCGLGISFDTINAAKTICSILNNIIVVLYQEVEL